MSNLDFKTVVPAAQAGDKAAQDALMANFYGWSVTEAQRLLKDSEAAKDVAVDFWEWMFAKQGVLEYDAAKGAFYPWMRLCVHRRAKDALYRKKAAVRYEHQMWSRKGHGPNTDGRAGGETVERNPALVWEGVSYADQGPDPADLLSALQDTQAIASKLRTARHKEVFWRLIEGTTPEEIAEEIGVSVKRVRNLIGDVRAVINEQIGENDG